jgi:hypothetical protein
MIIIIKIKMISKSDFGIKPSEGFAKTFFTNDW